MRSMRALDSRLNSSAQAQQSERLARAKNAHAPRLDFGAAAPLKLIPEDAELLTDPNLRRLDAQSRAMGGGGNDDAALRAYMERHTYLHGSGSLTAGHANARSGGWNYR